jgi:hypothetical protein
MIGRVRGRGKESSAGFQPAWPKKKYPPQKGAKGAKEEELGIVLRLLRLFAARVCPAPRSGGFQPPGTDRPNVLGRLQTAPPLLNETFGVSTRLTPTMSSPLLPFRSVHALTFAALALLSAGTVLAVDAVPNAPGTSPAPMVDKPLTPAANDTPGEQPTPQHAWVPGHWRWHEGSYVWESGRWEIPPTPNVIWTQPVWQPQGRGYVLQEGYWQETDPNTATVVAAQQQGQPEVVATEPPPPPQRELIYERPTASHVWVPGYWGWQNGRHVWVSGQWSTTPRANMMWVPPRWEHRGGNRYVFVAGYWRDAVVVAQPPPQPQVVVTQPMPAPPQQVIVVSAPPAPRREVVYARPSSHHVWVPGYWSHRGGRHVWIAGHYELPPRGYSRWNEPRWERRGGNYIFIEGRWGR